MGYHLQMIEAGAEMTARHAGRLFERPDWETLAEDELAKAEKVLADALLRVRAARELYRRKNIGS
jgi:hypothetical protein